MATAIRVAVFRLPEGAEFDGVWIGRCLPGVTRREVVAELHALEAEGVIARTIRPHRFVRLAEQAAATEGDGDG